MDATARKDTTTTETQLAVVAFRSAKPVMIINLILYARSAET